MSIAVYTLVSEDGVLGLNGRRYLENDDETLMLFKSVAEAKAFVKDHGEGDNEYIDYEEMDNE